VGCGCVGGGVYKLYNGYTERLHLKCYGVKIFSRGSRSPAGQGVGRKCKVGRPDHPTKIPVDKIAEEWRSQSSKGRYESAMWREAGLEEPGASAANGGTRRRH
jgi:hypothetical protein